MHIHQGTELDDETGGSQVEHVQLYHGIRQLALALFSALC